jgi:hypothetical protein
MKYEWYIIVSPEGYRRRINTTESRAEKYRRDGWTVTKESSK